VATKNAKKPLAELRPPLVFLALRCLLFPLKAVEMHKGIKGLVFIAMAVIVEPVSANCGPFGVFGDTDYCIACPGKVFKENSCPGGEVGLVAEGTLHPGCSVSYYGPATCHTNASMSRQLLDELEKSGHLKIPNATPIDQARLNATRKDRP